jgi:RNA polymerase sigma factor for flagellar operon FliA
VEFSSYARFRIRSAILDSVRELDWKPRNFRLKGRIVGSTYASFPANSDARPTKAKSSMD